jgi:hypothetical protein
MKIKFISNDLYLYGNKGAVWSNKVHIAQSGSFTGRTLCGTPMLATNHAAHEGIQEAGCPECIHMMNKQPK